MRAGLSACNEFECETDVINAGRHRSAFNSRDGIVNPGAIFHQWLDRLKRSNQAALTSRFDRWAIAVAVHFGFVARSFEIHGNTNRLIATMADEPRASVIG